MAMENAGKLSARAPAVRGKAEDSARTVAILEKFLRSGVDPAAAMKILNSVLLLRLKPGSLAVVASDGVLADEEDDAWIRELLGMEQTDMKALARSVLREAEERYGASDDMTVLTIRVEERK